MATLHFPPGPGLLTPSSSRGSGTGARRSSSPTTTVPPPGPKLRDSCHACASSKVKCHKEKPSCSRCTKRGLTCEYVATKRVGRKHDHNRSNQSVTSEASTITAKNNGNSRTTGTSPRSNASISVAATSQQSLPLNSWFAPNSTTDFLPSLASVHPSPRPTTAGNSSHGLFPNVLSPVDHSLNSVLTNLTSDLDDFFASPVSFSGHDQDSEMDLLGQPDFYAGIDTHSSHGGPSLLESFTMFEKTMSDLPQMQPNPPRSPPNSRASPAAQPPPSATSACHDFQSYSSSSHHGGGGGGGVSHHAAPFRLHASDTPCTCLVQALGLMQQLFPDAASSSACSSMGSSLVGTPQHMGAGGQDQQQHTSSPNSLPTIQTVIEKNEHTIKAVSAMLQCPCAQDGYLLAIMSLIVFKVLGWYAAAAKSPNGYNHNNNNNSSMGSGSNSSNNINSNSNNQHDVLDSAASSMPGTRSGTQSPRPGMMTPQHNGRPSHTRHSSVAGSEQVQALQGPAVVGSYCLEGEDSARMAGQLVLSELHRVQRLVNQLSARLRAQAARSHALAGGCSVANTPGSAGGSSSFTNASSSSSAAAVMGGEFADAALAASPFSALMLDQLGADLKRRLRALSLEIVEGLRRD